MPVTLVTCRRHHQTGHPRNTEIYFRENVHQVGSILFQTNFIITQLAMFYLLIRFDHHLQELNVQWSLLTRGRGEQTVPHVMTWSAAPLVSVHSWFRLSNPDGFFYPTCTPVRLFIHHFRSLPVYHTVVSVRMVSYG